MCYEICARTTRGQERQKVKSAITASGWVDEFAERMIGKPTVTRNGVNITDAELADFVVKRDSCA